MIELDKATKNRLNEINRYLRCMTINNINEIKFIDFKLNIENLINKMLRHNDVYSEIFLYTTTKIDIMNLVVNSSDNIILEIVDKHNYKTYGVVTVDIFSDKNYCINEIKLYK